MERIISFDLRLECPQLCHTIITIRRDMSGELYVETPDGCLNADMLQTAISDVIIYECDGATGPLELVLVADAVRFGYFHDDGDDRIIKCASWNEEAMMQNETEIIDNVLFIINNFK